MRIVSGGSPEKHHPWTLVAGWRGKSYISNIIWFALEANQILHVNGRHFEKLLLTLSVSM
jgi:hypothetical protein